RKLIVKNLEKAAEEAEEQEVTGGAFHAWKNLFNRTLEKMKKPFTVFATSALLVGGLASCTAGEPIPEPTTTPSASVQVLDIGDALGGPLVTDEWGTYQKLVVDPDGIANNFENTVVSLETLEEVGFTIEDAKKAQYVAVRWLVEDIIDNPIIDMPYDRTE